MSDSMQVHGSCHCGAIEFEAAVDPTGVTICHCTACQNLMGSAYRVTVAVSAQGFPRRAARRKHMSGWRKALSWLGPLTTARLPQSTSTRSSRP